MTEELEKWIRKRLFLIETVEKRFKYYAKDIIISEKDLEFLLEEAREEERANINERLVKEYYFGFARGICWNCKAHEHYLKHEDTKPNRGYGVLKACKKCEKRKHLFKDGNELTGAE